MQVSITIDGVERKFAGDYHELHNVDWNETVREHLDDVQKYEEDKDKQL